MAEWSQFMRVYTQAVRQPVNESGLRYLLGQREYIRFCRLFITILSNKAIFDFDFFFFFFFLF